MLVKAKGTPVSTPNLLKINLPHGPAGIAVYGLILLRFHVQRHHRQKTSAFDDATLAYNRRRSLNQFELLRSTKSNLCSQTSFPFGLVPIT